MAPSPDEDEAHWPCASPPGRRRSDPILLHPESSDWSRPACVRSCASATGMHTCARVRLRLAHVSVCALCTCAPCARVRVRFVHMCACIGKGERKRIREEEARRVWFLVPEKLEDKGTVYFWGWGWEGTWQCLSCNQELSRPWQWAPAQDPVLPHSRPPVSTPAWPQGDMSLRPCTPPLTPHSGYRTLQFPPQMTQIHFQVLYGPLPQT